MFLAEDDMKGASGVRSIVKDIMREGIL